MRKLLRTHTFYNKRARESKFNGNVIRVNLFELDYTTNGSDYSSLIQ